MANTDLSRRAEYVDGIRKMHRGKRLIGMIGCLLGVLVMMTGAYIGGGQLVWLRYVGLAVIAASWMLFIYVMVSRTRYVRAHPFDPGT